MEWREGLTADGKPRRRRKFFRHEVRAKGFLREKEAQARAGGLQRDPLTPIEWAAIERSREMGVNPLVAIEAAAQQERERARSCSVQDAIWARIRSAERSGRSERYLGDLRARLCRFSVRIEGDRLKMADVTKEHVEAHLSTLRVSPVSVANELRLISGLFRFATKRGWCEADPTALIERPKAPGGEIGILTPAQGRALLDAAEPLGMASAIAIGMFAGLRSAELERLDWCEVRPRHIEVTAAKAKTAQRRLVDMEPNLAAILDGRRQDSGPVHLGRKAFESAIADSAIAPWPRNAMRHSYASYHLAKYQDAAKTALMLGHSSTALLFQHYRELVTREAAEEWFGI